MGNKNNNSLASIFASIFNFEELKSVEPKALILSHLVPEGINLYVAKGGEGKTLLAYHIVYSLLKEGWSVIYVDFDNPVDLPKSRGLLEVVENYKDRFVYLNLQSYQKWAEKNGGKGYIRFLEWIFSSLPDEGRYLVVIDSLQNFLPNVSDDALTFNFLKLLRKWSQEKKITYLVLHHISKVSKWTKGSTNIVNMSDVTYKVRAEREGGIVVSYSLFLEKARYLSPESLTIQLKDEYEVEISQYAIEDENTKMILRVLVSILRKEGPMNQSELYKKVNNKGFSRKKVEPVLKEYVGKGLFKAERKKQHNSIIYSVNEDSEYISLLFHKELSEIKKALLNLVEGLLDDEVGEFADEVVVKQFRFLTPYDVKNAIYRLTDEESEEVYKQLADQFPDSPEINPEVKKQRILERIEIMAIHDKIVFLDNLNPPLVVNGRTYTTLRDIEEDLANIPLEALQEYEEQLREKSADKVAEELEGFVF